MIVSHKHKLVFTRPTKTGSSSAQVMLLESGIADKESDIHSGYIEDHKKDFLFLPKLPSKFLKSKDDRGVFAEQLSVMHMTPSDLIRAELLSEDAVGDYMFISIVRNPIERYISGWLYEGGTDIDRLTLKIRKGNYPLSVMGPKTHEYFSHNGVRLKNMLALRQSHLNADLKKFITEAGCDISEQKRIKTANDNKFSPHNYTEWVPKKELNLLRGMLFEEIEFYKEITGDDV